MTNAPDLNRRGFCGAAALTAAAVPLGLVGFQEAAIAKGATDVAQQSTGDTSIRPLRVNTSEAELEDMRRRINVTRWPERETVADTSQGVPLAVMRTLASYWATGYDWRKCEAKLNALPQFVTEIDGLDIYFIHVRSKQENALPIIVTHAWPGSPIEQLKIIDPLTNPTAYGASASDAFHVVSPGGEALSDGGGFWRRGLTRLRQADLWLLRQAGRRRL